MVSVFFSVVLALSRRIVNICWRGKKKKKARLWSGGYLCPKVHYMSSPQGKKITDFCVPYQKKKEKKKIQILSCQLETLRKWHFLTHSVEKRQLLSPHCPHGDVVFGAGLPQLSPEGFTRRFPFLLNLCTPWVCSKRPGLPGGLWWFISSWLGNQAPWEKKKNSLPSPEG